MGLAEKLLNNLKFPITNLKCCYWKLIIEKTTVEGGLKAVQGMLGEFGAEYERLFKALEDIDWNEVK